MRPNSGESRALSGAWETLVWWSTTWSNLRTAKYRKAMESHGKTFFSQTFWRRGFRSGSLKALFFRGYHNIGYMIYVPNCSTFFHMSVRLCTLYESLLTGWVVFSSHSQITFSRAATYDLCFLRSTNSALALEDQAQTSSFAESFLVPLLVLQ